MQTTRLGLGAIAAVGVAQPVLAAEDVLIGPAPDWVVRGEMPEGGEPAEGSEDLPVRFVYSDSQTLLEPDRQVRYVSYALDIQAPQGLDAGNLSLPWRPEFDELTVHKVLIRRADETIDVLEEGQTFSVLRREQNLEWAMLDGVLTANLFPAGLEVGDTLEVAFSIEARNPVLEGHAEATLGPLNIPAEEIRVRLQWPEDTPLRLAATDGLPEWERRQEAGMEIASLRMTDVEPMMPPSGAPARFSLLRMAEASDFASWQDVATLFVPLYEEASRIPAEGNLRERVEQIRQETDDPARRAERALSLVQDDVRYVALSMGTGGLVPANTETTWSRRFGDCKAKTALLLGILDELDIEAEAVAVNTVMGDALPERLPMVGVFDHILVRARIGGREYWMDGTRTGDTSLGRLRTPAFHWGMPVVESGAELVRMMPGTLDRPTEDLVIRMDASEGIHAPVPTEIEVTMRGDLAIGTNAGLAQLTGTAREQALERYWRGQYDFVTPEKMDARFDHETGELVLSMSGTADLDWESGYYETDNMRVGYSADFERVSHPDSNAPFALRHPFFDRALQTIVLPEGFDESLIDGGEYDEVAGGIEYRREAGFEGNVFTATTSKRSTRPELSVQEAHEAEPRLKALWEDHLHLELADDYQLTDADIAALSTAESQEDGLGLLITRGNELLDAGQFEEALSLFDTVTEQDPDDVWGWANRAVTLVQMGRLEEAEAAAGKAEAIDPSNFVMWQARGLVELWRQNPESAAAAFSRALESKPDSTFALFRRAGANLQLGRFEDALEDAERLVELSPQYPGGYAMKVTALHELDRSDRARETIEQMLRAAPDNAEARIEAGDLYLMLGMDEEAARVEETVSAAITEKPTARALTVQANRRSVGETDLKLQELGQALEIDPDFVPALVSRANTLWMDYRYDEAMADAERALELSPAFIPAYDVKAKILADQNRPEAAAEVIEAAIAANPDLPAAYGFAAHAHRRLGNSERADELVDLQLGLGAEGQMQANALLARAQGRPNDDLEGRASDISQALEMAPNSEQALWMLADLEMDQGNFGSAASTFRRLREMEGDEPELVNGLAMALARAGRDAEAEAAFDKARSLAGNADSLNSLCWNKAMEDIALERALDECRASLAMDDRPATRDSLAMVLLRMDRLEEARGEFDRVLEEWPKLSNSLFGRAIVRARMGDVSGAREDAQNARKSDVRIDQFFRDIGIEVPSQIAKGS